MISGAPLELGSTGNAQRITGSYTEQPRFYPVRRRQPGPNGLQIDPSAFVLPPIGNAGPWPRQYMRGPGINNQNISIFKNFPFAGESGQYLQLRFEMFNAFNHTQFSAINAQVQLALPSGAALFSDYSNAVITTNLRPAGSTEPLGRFFGEYNGASNPRIIQLGIKLYF